ncbi:O-methyltransferase [Amycolatopsis pithecellobii]|uniref:O-methyltransferase n=1 Tax=Amycolatopsis pithecellobii TaxID=664692 RepID=A0A6N7Z2P1_9PSEU|nr:O-methyltransferase [Amycolatopsis pithecellobii]MTD55219.1 O-methyltransferase [Amycolatopsis pithecellobii]
MTTSTDDLPKGVALTPEISRYITEQLPPLSATQRWLIERTRALGGISEMQIPPVQGALLTMLTQIVQAKTVVEVGTFTGYSTLAFASGLVPGGRVITCDRSAEWTAIAAEAWEAAGVADRIQVELGPAAETLGRLPEEPFIDLAFVDADKTGYLEYWELLVPRLRPGGLLLADNVLYAGEAASPDAEGNAKAIREFNAHVLADDRTESLLLPIADGLTIARKKP